MSTKNEIKLHKRAIGLQYHGNWYFAIRNKRQENGNGIKIQNWLLIWSNYRKDRKIIQH